MYFGRALQIAAIILFITLIVCSQTKNIQTERRGSGDTSITKNSRLEKLVLDTKNLKLPENRAIVDARLGKIFWKFDRKRASTLFRRSIDELIAAQNEVAPEKNSPVRTNLLVYGQTRQKILEIIAVTDVELVFELFAKSRPEMVGKALKGISVETASNSYNGMTLDKYLLFQEDNLEQALIRQAISQYPERAADILHRQAPERITGTTLQLLKLLYEKDQPAAESLTAEIIRRVLAAKFTQNSGEFQFTTQLLYESNPNNPAAGTFSLDAHTAQDLPLIDIRTKTGTRTLRIDSQTLHSLAAKMADFLIADADRQGRVVSTDMTSILVKLLPERAVELKEKTSSVRRSTLDIFPTNNEAQAILQSNPTPEKLLAEADKFPAAFREEFFVKAAEQIADAGNLKRAQEILTANFPQERLPEMFGSLYWWLGYRAMEKLKYDEALGLFEQAPAALRFSALVGLANALLINAPNGQPKAVAVLEKARRLVSEKIATREEFTKMGELAAAYAFVDPEKGFPLLEKLIGKFVEVSESAAVVDNFQGNLNIRNSEFLIDSNFRGLADLNVPLDNFIKADFERTMNIIDKMQRPDERIVLQLKILETAFNG